VRFNWLGPTETHNGLRCQGKTTLPKDKKALCIHTAALDNRRGQQLAAVAPYVRSQIGTEFLMLGGVASLAQRI